VVQNGAVLTYQGQWRYGSNFSNSADKDAEAVATLLTQSGIVVNSEQNDSGLIAYFSGNSYNITLKLFIQNGLGFGSVTDVVSIVRNAVYQVTGLFPISDSVPYDQEPGIASSPTGQAVNQPNPSGPCDKSNCTFADIFKVGSCCGFSEWLANMTTTGLWGIGIAVIGILLGITYFSPQKE
jgi:hypothetical protein